MRQLFEGTLERLCGHCTVLNDNMHSCMEQMTSSITELGNKISAQIDRMEHFSGGESKEAQIIKGNLQKYWKNELNQRKTAYIKCYRATKLANLYKEMCPEENPFVPRKFRCTIHENVSKDEEKLRSKQSIQHLLDEVEVLTIRAENFKKQFEEIDNKAEQYLQAQTSDPDVKGHLITLWKNDCKLEEDKTHELWKEKEDFFRSEFDKEKAGETDHTLLITKENEDNTESNVQTNNITPQPTEGQLPPSDPRPQYNQGFQYQDNRGQNFPHASNPNFIPQFNNNYFRKINRPYRPQGKRFYNKRRQPNRGQYSSGYQGFQQRDFVNQNYGNGQWFRPEFAPPPMKQRSEFLAPNFRQNPQPPQTPHTRERQNVDEQSRTERPGNTNSSRTFNPTYTEVIANSAGHQNSQETSNNQQ